MAPSMNHCVELIARTLMREPITPPVVVPLLVQATCVVPLNAKPAGDAVAVVNISTFTEQERRCGVSDDLVAVARARDRGDEFELHANDGRRQRVDHASGSVELAQGAGFLRRGCGLRRPRR